MPRSGRRLRCAGSIAENGERKPWRPGNTPAAILLRREREECGFSGEGGFIDGNKYLTKKKKQQKMEEGKEKKEMCGKMFKS